MAEYWYCLRGAIDIATAPQLRTDLAAVIAQNGAHVVIDCTGLSFIDSGGIAVLLDAQRALESTGRHLVLVNVGRAPRRTFEVLGLTDLLQYDNEPAT